MGNRDVRRREKRKPKKKEIKQVSTPARSAIQYKPTAPLQGPRSSEDFLDKSQH